MIEYDDGTKLWCLNKLLHRTDGPAIERNNGDREWYLNGKRNREDGPAIERVNGVKKWCLNGFEYSEQSFNATQLNKKLNSELQEKFIRCKKIKI